MKQFPSPEAETLGLTYIDEYELLFNVGDLSSNIFLINLDGKVLDRMVLPLEKPIGLTWDGEALVIAERGANRIFRMRPTILLH